MVLWTFFQHETAVAGWYGLLSPSFDHWLTSATVVFTVVSAIDLVWLYMWFYVNKKAIAALMNVASFRAMVDRLGSRPRFERIKSYFSASHVSESDEVLEIKPTDSNFRRLVKRSGYLGILLLAALPGPGLKELGILMALTPKYKRHGFALMYIGGLIKTTGTLMVYGGLHEIFEQLIRKSVS
ncbi:MAG: hypothetical protein KDC45_06460 [Bacteroidetes bacterium]|nr:hypothetical protein [Bacteroidota bacterium]